MTTSVRECVRIHVKIMAELVAPIVAIDGMARACARGSRASPRKPPSVSRRSWAACEVGPGGVLDPEEITQRALRFPGERECEVRLALGELISYLEFELLNHPKITEPRISSKEWRRCAPASERPPRPDRRCSPAGGPLPSGARR